MRRAIAQSERFIVEDQTLGVGNPQLEGFVGTAVAEVIDAIPEGIAYFGSSDRLVFWNRRYAEIWITWGVTLQQGTSFIALMKEGIAAGRYPEAQGRERLWLQERIAVREQAEKTTERAEQGGVCLRIDYRRTPSGGRVTTCIDITDLKHQEGQVSSARAFLDTIIESIPSMIMVKHGNSGRFLMLNRAGEDMLGVSREDLIGRTDHDVLPQPDADRLKELDRHVLNAAEPILADEEIIPTSKGPRFFKSKRLAIPSGRGGRHVLIISDDITESKAISAELARERERVVSANVAKTEFLANVSHEIRTPLNGMLGLTEGVLQTQLTAEQRELLELVVSSGRTLNILLNDVLDLAKIEAGQLTIVAEPFNLRKAVVNAARPFQSVATQKGLGFNLLFSGEEDLVLRGDAVRIGQIVSNLVNNAVKFTVNGEINVRVGTEAADGDLVLLTIMVEDTGVGFDEDVRDKLFERFQQADGSVTRRFGGTGLGLSIAGDLARMMEGSITCTGTPGEGATFIFTAAFEGCQISAAAAAPAPARRQLGSAEIEPRILLAEDHPINQKVIQVLLGDFAELKIVGDGKAAVSAFLAGNYDLILMDTQMPELDGISATRAIRSEEQRLGRTRTPIISLTANAMASQVAECLAAGADLHLAKPISAESLFQAVETAMASASRQPAA